MPYSVSCSPAPVTFTIRPKFGVQFLVGLAWACVVDYWVFTGGWRKINWDNWFDLAFVALMSVGVLLSFIRRERIEVYPDRMVWSKTYFGFTRSKSALLADIIGVEWCESNDDGRGRKTPDHVEFYLPVGTVKACYGFTFEEFEGMRNDIRGFYPDLVKRWGTARVRSKEFTLLNLS